MDAIALLKQQHREVEDLFEKIEEGGPEKTTHFQKLADSLALHTTIEEKVFYPQTKTARTEDLLLEAVEEHLSAKRLLADMLKADPEGEAFDAKVKVLKEQIEHHVEEEEEELFPKVKKEFSDAQLQAMGELMEQMAADIATEVEEPRQLIPGETDKPAPL